MNIEDIKDFIAAARRGPQALIAWWGSRRALKYVLKKHAKAIKLLEDD